MEPTTYKLDLNGSAAETYYPAIAEFTDEVLAGAEDSFAIMARSYRDYLNEYELEELHSTSKPGKPVTGVVASACLSVLVQGGWELKRYDVPAQCVLLNECGCRKHWHSEGFPTQLEVRELKRLLKSAPQSQSL